MPRRPKRPCRQPGCVTLTNEGYCAAHRRAMYKRIDRNRGNASQRGYDARWRKAREVWLHEHPLCVECQSTGKLTPATDVDHIIPHRGDPVLFWDRTNWQSLCDVHSNAKSAREGMGSNFSIALNR